MRWLSCKSWINHKQNVLPKDAPDFLEQSRKSSYKENTITLSSCQKIALFWLLPPSQMFPHMNANNNHYFKLRHSASHPLSAVEAGPAVWEHDLLGAGMTSARAAPLGLAADVLQELLPAQPGKLSLYAFHNTDHQLTYYLFKSSYFLVFRCLSPCQMWRTKELE